MLACCDGVGPSVFVRERCSYIVFIFGSKCYGRGYIEAYDLGEQLVGECALSIRVETRTRCISSRPHECIPD